MKGYIKRILTIVFIIGIFVMSFNIKLDNSLSKTFRTIANSNKSADTCTTGNGKVYYVKPNVSTYLNIYNTNSQSGTRIGQLEKCTEVVVYCESNSWAKISKVSDKWVNLDYLSESQPAGCTNILTTTTDAITFGSVTKVYSAYGTSDNDVNQMYRDKPGSIIMTLNGITKMASDEQNKINVVITKNNTDVTSSFEISRTGINNGQAAFTIRMKSGLVYDEGQYNVKFSYANATKSSTFDLVGKYYDFSIDVEKTKGDVKNYQNRQNIWKVNINSIEPENISSNTKNNFKLVVLNAKGNDVSEKFIITYKEGYIEVENKRTGISQGKYQMVISYTDKTYTTARPNYNQTYDFTMGSRNIEFDEDSSLRTSFRYERYDIKEAYKIKVIRKSSNNIIIKERNNDGTYSDEITMTQDEFLDIYSDFDTLAVTFGTDNRPVIVFNTVRITRFLNNKYTYTDGNATNTATLDELEGLYPGISSSINITDTSGLKKYTFDNNGYIEYNAQGNKTIHQKKLQDKNQPVLSSSGGIMNFVINHNGLSSDDTSVMPVITRKDGVVMTESDGFRIVSQQYENINDDNNGKMYLTIEYNNDDYDKYTNTYTVSYSFKDTLEKPSFEFTLTDGEVDYYLISAYDGHLTDPFDAINSTPPGNKRYEYYLGFYLMKKGGIPMNYKPSNEMTYKVFTEQVDCEDNSSAEACENSMYYFKQVNYTLSIVRYINNEITFDVTFDTPANNKRYTLSVAEFKEKYYEVWDMINNYTFDSSGYLSGNKYDIQIEKIYNGEDNETLVDYIPNGETETITKSVKEFSIAYPEYYVYITNHFTTDENDFVVNGRLRGSYRIRTENGVSIQGKEVTDQFNFTVDIDPYNVDRAITVLPSSEVQAGTYYVYVGFEGRMGVGYTNNSLNPVITREQFPQMWNRNIHMTTISYVDPVYDIDFEEPVYTNIGNDTNSLFANISSKAVFGITTKYIYDFDGFSYHVERKTESGWVNADSLFSLSSKFTSDDSKVELITIPGTTLGGDYRLIVEYNKNGYSLKEPKSYKFSVNNKYYGIAFNIIPNYDLTFIKNYTQTKVFDSKGYFISDQNNIQFSLKRYIDNENYKELTWDKANKKFLINGTVAFKYDIVTKQTDENTLDYIIYLTNIKNTLEEGEYELTISYAEGNGETSSSSIKFNVSAEDYRYAIGEERAKVNSEGYSIQRDVYVSFIDYDDLDFINYKIIYSDENGKRVDVSSADSPRRMFTITDNFTQNKYNQEYDGVEYEYKGLLNIAVNPDVVDFNGEYYIEMSYDKSAAIPFDFTSPGKLFAWSSDLKITAELNNNGVKKPVNNFFLNVDDVTLTINIDTPHEDMANYIITSSCLDGSCTPTQEINLNSRFDFIKSESNKNKIVLKYKNDLPVNQKLTKGTYALVVYYNNNDMDINTFDVVTEYADIKFDDVVTYSDISENHIEKNLFKNKVGHIEIPVKVTGVDYDKTMVSITRNGVGDYSHAFTYNRGKYESDHVLELTYNPNSGIDYGDYNIMVSYVNADKVTISDNVIVTLNESYFSFAIGKPTYNPNPPIANADPYGEVIFDIKTEEIPNISIPVNDDDKNTEKHKFAEGTVITNSSNVDVTSMFDIVAKISLTSPSNFNLVIKYTKNSVIPGLYNIKVSYRYNGYTITDSAYFEIADYEKDITVKNMEILTNTNDKRIHNNVGGIFKIYYESIFDVSVDDIAVNVMNNNNILVTDNFNIVKGSNYINVELVPKSPALSSGDYTINIIYTDSQTGNVKNHSIPIKIYGYYKQITINNMTPSTSKIYADLTDQYYTFDLDTSNITDTELSNIKVRVYDKYGNIVNSSISTDKVNNIFDIVNEVKTNGYFKINILAFKAPVGEYEVELLLPNEDDDYNISNRLTFKVSSTAYRVRLSPDSTITPSNIYNSNNTDYFYDADSAKVNYLFTSNYRGEDANYSIKVFKDGVTVQEINDLNLGLFSEFGIEYFTTKIDINNLDVGTYEIAICLKGLPYESKTIQVYKYIPVTNVTIANNGEIVSDSISTNIGTKTQIIYYIEPNNATNNVLELSSSDESIFTIENNTITPIAVGSAKLIVNHRDYNKEINVNVTNLLTSDKYFINNKTKTIIVKSLENTEFTKNEFISNLNGLSNDYQVKNLNGNIIKDQNGLVGTKSTIISGEDTYMVILLGDVNGDGKISALDYVKIKNHIMETSIMSDNALLISADLNEDGKISTLDYIRVKNHIMNRGE